MSIAEYRRIVVAPVAGALGAEIRGVDLASDLADETVAEIRRAWLEIFCDVALWQKLHASESRRNGYAETRLGRRWRWSWRALDPETLPEDIPFRDDLLVGFSKPLCLNFPVQGSAAEVMALALVMAHRALPSPAKLIATVHDELVIECPTPLADEIKALVTEAMTTAFTRLFPEAPCAGLVDATSGPSWGELE